jgi:hypothetical protein
MKNTTRGNIIKALAIILDVGAPLIATLTQFPIWVEKSSEATFSGMFILCAFLSCLPFINYIKEYLKSPSILVTWMIAFVLLVALNSIIEQMIVVCFVGLLANCIGAVIYKIGKHISEKNE